MYIPQEILSLHFSQLIFCLKLHSLHWRTLYKVYKIIINIFNKFQFIVVSLKDGMFNNANVLFRTKFVDGMSTVSRTTQAQNSKKWRWKF